MDFYHHRREKILLSSDHVSVVARTIWVKYWDRSKFILNC
jgi:hypothetical protein